MQEVDEVSSFWREALAERGYELRWRSKVDAARQRDGAAIAWRTERVRIAQSPLPAAASVVVVASDHNDTHAANGVTCYELGGAQIALRVDLELVEASVGFCVVATHLKAKHGYEAKREAQVQALLDHLQAVPARVPLLVCGDFNDERTSLATRRAARASLAAARGRRRQAHSALPPSRRS